MAFTSRIGLFWLGQQWNLGIWCWYRLVLHALEVNSLHCSNASKDHWENNGGQGQETVHWCSLWIFWFVQSEQHSQSAPFLSTRLNRIWPTWTEILQKGTHLTEKIWQSFVANLQSRCISEWKEGTFGVAAACRVSAFFWWKNCAPLQNRDRERESTVEVNLNYGCFDHISENCRKMIHRLVCKAPCKTSPHSYSKISLMRCK